MSIHSAEACSPAAHRRARRLATVATAAAGLFALVISACSAPPVGSGSSAKTSADSADLAVEVLEGSGLADIVETFKDSTSADADTDDAALAAPDGADAAAIGIEDAENVDLLVVDQSAEDAVALDEQDAEPEDLLPWWQQPIADEYIGQEDASTEDAASLGNDAGIVTPASICAPKIAITPVAETISGGGKVDIIIWIDTSGSMTEEAAWMNQNLNGFANYIASKKIDFHLIVLGKTVGNIKICIDPPLANVACGTTGPNFLAVPIQIASNDGLSKISTALNYAKYSGFLRKDAAKNIIAITDDNSSMSAPAFTAQWGFLQPMGWSKDFIFHSICAFGPLPGKGCKTGAAIGTEYLKLTALTKGAQFQICEVDWKPIFEALAKSVAETAKQICSYKLVYPDGGKANLAALKLSHYENKFNFAMEKIGGPADCAAHPNGWWFDNPLAPDAVVLCEQKCQTMSGGVILFNYGCQ